jgi:hypothetical protein
VRGEQRCRGGGVEQVCSRDWWLSCIEYSWCTTGTGAKWMAVGRCQLSGRNLCLVSVLYSAN